MIVIFILSLIPIVIWTTILPLPLRFSDFISATTSVGQILGLLGMTLYSINLILAGRLKILDKYFKGLDKVYAHHRIIGTIAFSMLLFHPLFLVAKYVTFSLQEAALFFIPFIGSLSVTWGILSLMLMIILLSITFYTKIKYNIWKFSHKFMTIAFLFAVIHTFMISSDVSRNNFLRYYVLTLAVLGLVIIFRKAYLNQTLVGEFKYKVSEVKDLGNEIVSIDMTPIKEKITFTSGQFVFVSFHDKNIGSESHPFR
jgi:predicted ferric reductase